MNKIVTLTLAITAAIAWSASASAVGAPPINTNFVKSPGRLPLVRLNAAHRGAFVARDETANAGLTPISNNFTQYVNSPYWGWFGYAIVGPQGGGANGIEQWLASAFTPKVNRIATRVEVPALYYSGTNGVDLSLNDDAGGLPGKALHTWHLTNLPGVACCTTVGGSDKNGISLTAGKQYWVVVSTNANEQTAAAVWGLTEFADVQKFGTSFAIYCGGNGCTQLGFTPNTWHIQSNSVYGLAFSVYGR